MTFFATELGLESRAVRSSEMTCQQAKSSWIESRKMGTDAVESNPGGVSRSYRQGRGTRTTAQLA
jgi:hypothetical protein